MQYNPLRFSYLSHCSAVQAATTTITRTASASSAIPTSTAVPAGYQLPEAFDSTLGYVAVALRIASLLLSVLTLTPSTLPPFCPNLISAPLTRSQNKLHRHCMPILLQNFPRRPNVHLLRPVFPPFGNVLRFLHRRALPLLAPPLRSRRLVHGVQYHLLRPHVATRGPDPIGQHLRARPRQGQPARH